LLWRDMVWFRFYNLEINPSLSCETNYIDSTNQSGGLKRMSSEARAWSKMPHPQKRRVWRHHSWTSFVRIAVDFQYHVSIITRLMHSFHCYRDLWNCEILLSHTYKMIQLNWDCVWWKIIITFHLLMLHHIAFVFQHERLKSKQCFT
jgi:hypothetical protein